MCDCGILENSCQCEKCLCKTEEALRIAREKWNNGERVILFRTWANDADYGQNLIINDFDCGDVYANEEAIVRKILEFLGLDGVKVCSEYDD